MNLISTPPVAQGRVLKRELEFLVALLYVLFFTILIRILIRGSRTEAYDRR
jgi:hypothetical protein